MQDTVINPNTLDSVRPDPSITLRTKGLVEGFWLRGWWFDKALLSLPKDSPRTVKCG
jgi:hypothetical protein